MTRVWRSQKLLSGDSASLQVPRRRCPAHAGGVNQHTFPPFRHSNGPDSPLSTTTLHTVVGTSCPNLGRAKAGVATITNTAATNTATTTILTMRFNAPPPCLRTLPGGAFAP